MTTGVEEREQTQDPADDFAASLQQDLIQLGPPEKKRRGRPPKDANDTTPKRTRRTSATRIKTEIKGAITLANTAYVSLGGETAQRYGLLEPEIDALVEALYAEIDAHPEWAVWFERVGKLSPHLQLAGVLISIALPRFAMAMGQPMEGPENDDGNAPELPNRYAAPDPADASVSVETGRTYGDNRGYGNGQVNPSGASSSSA